MHDTVMLILEDSMLGLCVSDVSDAARGMAGHKHEDVLMFLIDLKEVNQGEL